MSSSDLFCFGISENQDNYPYIPAKFETLNSFANITISDI